MHEPNVSPFIEKMREVSGERLKQRPRVWDYVHPSAPEVGMLVVGVTRFEGDVGLLGATEEAGPRRYRHMAHPALEGELVPLTTEDMAKFVDAQHSANADAQPIPRAA